jgi:hypothetical protein
MNMCWHSKLATTSFGLVYTFLGTSRLCILPPCFLDLAQPLKTERE